MRIPGQCVDKRGLQRRACPDIRRETSPDGRENGGNPVRILGAYAYTIAKITKALDGSAGHTSKQAPQNMASLWADYKVLGDTAFGGLSFGGGIRYVGASYA